MGDHDTWRELGQQLRVDSIRSSAAAGSGHPTSLDVRRRPDGRADQQVPALRLRRAGRPAQRPPHLLEGPRLAAALRHLQGGRRHQRRRDADLPQGWAAGSRAIPPRCCRGSTWRPARWARGCRSRSAWRYAGRCSIGSRIGSGACAATRRWPRARCGRRSRRRASTALDNLTAIIDVNRLGQTGETMHGWDLDAYVNRATGFRLARDRDRRPRRRGDRRRHGRCDRHHRPPDRDRGQAPRRATASRRSPTRTARTASRCADPEAAIAGAGRDPQHQRAVPKPERHCQAPPLRRPSGELSLPAYEIGTKEATRKAYGDALVALGDARGDVVALDGEVGNSTYSEEFAQAHPGPLRPVLHRRAADGGLRGRPPGPRLAPVRRHLRRVPVARLRLRADGGGQPRQHRAGRLARRGEHRRGRTVADGAGGPGHRCAPCTAAPCSTHRTRTRQPPCWPRSADREGIVFLRTTREKLPVIYPPGEASRSVEPRRALERRRPRHPGRGGRSPCTRR